MWVFLCIPRYIHCSWSTVMAQAHSVMHTSIRACFLCFFYNPYMSLFNSKNFFNLLVYISVHKIVWFTLSYGAYMQSNSIWHYPWCLLITHVRSIVLSVPRCAITKYHLNSHIVPSFSRRGHYVRGLVSWHFQLYNLRMHSNCSSPLNELETSNLMPYMKFWDIKRESEWVPWNSFRSFDCSAQSGQCSVVDVIKFTWPSIALTVNSQSWYAA